MFKVNQAEPATNVFCLPTCIIDQTIMQIVIHFPCPENVCSFFVLTLDTLCSYLHSRMTKLDKDFIINVDRISDREFSIRRRLSKGAEENKSETFPLLQKQSKLRILAPPFCIKEVSFNL